MNTVRTTCPYCGVGCGVLAQRSNGSAQVSGDPEHPANFGRLCSKGSALAETLDLESRLLHPTVQGRQTGWDEALNYAAEGFLRTIREHGPESVAFYVSGQLLTEDYYIANKLMKGFIGAANIDTNSRLCMASAVAGHKRAFGADVVPVCYEDLEYADLIVLVGSNTAWCHPVLFQRIVQAKERRPEMRLVVIDPRRTPTCELADLHLPVRLGTDVWLFNGLLSYLSRQNRMDAAFVTQHTRECESALRTADESAGDLAAVASACRVDVAAVEAFYELFASTKRVITAFSQGVNQSSSGTDKVNSIINCHLFTGRIGAPGMGPFSITGQPNAMGGREVGGMANMLAAHMDIENAEHRKLVGDFWCAPRMPKGQGLKAVDLFDAIHDGRIRAVWIIATNPIVSLPDANKARVALEQCPLVVVSDCVARTDTTRLAHVLLPAMAWGEKDGTVTNSERCISRQRAFLPAPGDARPDWWIVCEVAKRMGFTQGFHYDTPAEIFDEHARLSALGNEGTRAFNIGGLADLTPNEYAMLEPVQWPVLARSEFSTPGGPLAADPASSTEQFAGSGEELSKPSAGTHGAFVGSPLQTAGIGVQGRVSQQSHAASAAGCGPVPLGTLRLCSDGAFYFPDRKARFVSTHPSLPAYAVSDEYPLTLNTGRVRDQWHTMTRTGLAARLSIHSPEPFVDLHPQDALSLSVREGDLVRVATRWGSLVARLRSSGEIARGEVFVPIHWASEYSSDARVGALVNPIVDPISGEPEFKHTPARVEPFHVLWNGFALTRHRATTAELTWWTLARAEHHLRYELALRHTPSDWARWTRELLPTIDAHADYLDYYDPAAGAYRAAFIVKGRLEATAFFSKRANLPARAWLAALFANEALTPQERIALLAGSAPNARIDTSPIICACFNVPRDTIRACIAGNKLTTPRQVGERLKAGTNCGSCLPEIRSLLTETAAAT